MQSPPGFDSKDMMKQAENIWTMLDEMSANDPTAYKKFIDKQLQDGKTAMAPPSPHMAVKTNLMGSGKEDLYVNFCAWPRVPEPKSMEDPVPVTGVTIDKMDDRAGSYQMTSVAFNPKVLEKYGRESSNSVDRDTLINLAFDYIENQHNVTVCRRYTILGKDLPHKGCLKHILKTFSGKAKDDKQFESELEQLQKSFVPGAGGKTGLLDQLTSIAVGDSQSVSTNSESDQSHIRMPFEKESVSKSKLIEEITDESKGMTTPEYSVDRTQSETGREQIRVKISLPGVTSVQECELEISQDDISLEVLDTYGLHLELPVRCDEEDATAKFNKKLSILTVTMPCSQ